MSTSSSPGTTSTRSTVRPDGAHFECCTMLAAWAEQTIAGRDRRARDLQRYRNPELLADMARTVDHISAREGGDGRLYPRHRCRAGSSATTTSTATSSARQEGGSTCSTPRPAHHQVALGEAQPAPEDVRPSRCSSVAAAANARRCASWRSRPTSCTASVSPTTIAHKHATVPATVASPTCRRGAVDDHLHGRLGRREVVGDVGRAVDALDHGLHLLRERRELVRVVGAHDDVDGRAAERRPAAGDGHVARGPREIRESLHARPPAPRPGPRRRRA